MATAESTPDAQEIPQKRCKLCQQSFSATAEHFSRDAGKRDGLNNWCRACKAIKAYAWKKAHPEKIRAMQTAWRHANAEKHRATKRAQRRANVEKHRLRCRAWYAANAEKARANTQTWRHANAEKARADLRAWRAAHPEKIRATTRAWQSANPEKKRAADTRRRARKLNAPVNDFTAQQWRDMQAAYDYRCAYCDKRRKGKLTQDHITPLSKGGSHTASNIVPACKSCNSRKQAGPVLNPVQPLLLV